MNPFVYGLILTSGLILPLGIQNIFVFNQGASHHRLWSALPSALTAFVCDCILILLAILGVSIAILSIPLLKSILLVGFIFLMYMGWNTWKSEFNSKSATGALSIKKQIFFSISVSILNPHAIVDTVGVIGPNSLQFIGNEKIIFTAACICASFTWFLSLCTIGHFLRKLDQYEKIINVINKISAIIIWGIGMVLACHIFLTVIRI